MLKKLKQDLFCLSDIKVPLIVFTAISVILGVVTWATASGIPVFWRLTKKPPLCPPVAVLFVLSVLTYALFGVLAAICKGSSGGVPGPLINAAAAYFLALFWCPLFFSGRQVASLAALLVSAATVVPTAVRCSRFSPAVLLPAVPIWALEGYFIWLTVGFAVLK